MQRKIGLKRDILKLSMVEGYVLKHKEGDLRPFVYVPRSNGSAVKVKPVDHPNRLQVLFGKNDVYEKAIAGNETSRVHIVKIIDVSPELLESVEAKAAFEETDVAVTELTEHLTP